MLRSRWCARVSLAVVALGLMAGPSAAKRLCSTTTVKVVGVDCYGCPSYRNSAEGCGKVTKDTCTGILVQIGSACVKNESRCSQSYCNIGTCISDPWCYTTRTATSDQTSISKPLLC